MINFLYTSGGSSPDNGWRNILTAILFVVIAIGSFFYSHIKQVDFVAFKNRLIEPKDLALLHTDEVGGDSVFVPEPLIIPTLSPSSTPLDPDSFSAHHILVKDVETGTVLFSKDSYGVQPMASITKLMTALVLLEYDIEWATTTVVIGPDNLDTHVYAGEIYQFDELWHAMLIASSNKAALSLVHTVSDPAIFIDRMNEKARELGIMDTSFVDVTGISDGNASSASDIILLLEEALRHEDIRAVVTMSEYNLYSEVQKKNHHMWNTDWLVLTQPKPWITHSFDTIVGGKTGYTVAAGFNFVVKVEKNGHAIDIVILGSKTNESRFTEARDVGEWVYENFIWDE